VLRRSGLRIAQIIVTVVLIGLLLEAVNWSDLRTLAVDLQWGYLGLSFLFVLLSHLINVARWQKLLQPCVVSYSKLLSIYGAGLFGNNFLPTGIGGDGIRVAILSRERDVTLPRALVSVSLDRLLGLLGLAVLFLPALWYGIPSSLVMASGTFVSDRTNILLMLLVIVGIVLLAGAMWSLPWLRGAIRRVFMRFAGMRDGLPVSYGRWPAMLSETFGLSVLSQLLLAVTQWCVLKAVHVEVSFGATLWLILIVSFSLLLPITVNGLGLQEGIYVVLLSYYGVSRLSALGAALLIRLLMIAYSLIGGVISLGWNMPDASRPIWRRRPLPQQGEE
jgi:uncharacterized protein (TIRG00374 family)